MTGRVATAAAFLALVLAGTGAAACPAELRVVRLADGAVLAAAPARAFTLSYRHSVTLSRVQADYRVAADGTIRQTAERFADLGPGMTHGGAPPRREGAGYVLALDRPIDRLILRASPDAANRLHLIGAEIALTRWPGTPLEILARPCAAPSPGTPRP
ncbi:DUF1850 domain-containing protein [Pararhodobacter sp. SW119]|uniref:DUF1850 domain-containing protein n=1 Tax=Pararhodobacter sp. SW119 TaxID=2780075 RepID=UPI001ADF2F93|nr:DUF1850 domain-containing protein [Pararhodobacter sp. SW119]